MKRPGVKTLRLAPKIFKLAADEQLHYQEEYVMVCSPSIPPATAIRNVRENRASQRKRATEKRGGRPIRPCNQVSTGRYIRTVEEDVRSGCRMLVQGVLLRLVRKGTFIRVKRDKYMLYGLAADTPRLRAHAQ